MSACRFGVASTDITPDPDVDLYGLDGQLRTSKKVLDDLRATALCLDDGRGGTAIVISADIIWLSREVCRAVRRALQERIGLTPANVFLCATHTHGSPQLLKESHNPAQRDAAYESAFTDALVQSAVQAYAAMEPGSLYRAFVRCPVAVYRRKRLPNPASLKKLRWRTMIANRPVPDHPIDDVLTSVRIDDASGCPKAMLLNIACHPTLFRSNAVSADYPGCLRRILQERYGKGFETVFLQGFSGNLRPRVLRRAPLRFSTPFQALYALLFDRLHFEKDIGAYELEALAGRLAYCLDSGQYSPLGQCSIKAERSVVALPLAGGGREAHLGVHALQLTKNLVLLGLEGEIFMEYALWLRCVAEGAIPVACCGGMIGYVPDEAGLAAGGYEVERSLGEFGLPAPFASSIEERVKQGMLGALDGVEWALNIRGGEKND